MQQPEWDIYEGVILLEGYLRYRNDKIPKKTVVWSIMQQLRQMGENAGKNIDALYRNEREISCKLDCMESVFEGYLFLGSVPASIYETVYLYREAPDRYQKTLSKAKSLIRTRIKTAEDITEVSVWQDVLNVDFVNTSDYSFTEPVAYVFFDEYRTVNSWRVLYAQVCAMLFKEHQAVFDRLKSEPKPGRCENIIVDKDYRFWLSSPVMFADGYYVETNISNSVIVNNIRLLLDECRVDYTDLVIWYKKSNQPIQSVRETVDTVMLKRNLRSRESATKDGTQKYTQTAITDTKHQYGKKTKNVGSKSSYKETIIDAVIAVLQDAVTSMTTNEIHQAILDRHLYRFDTKGSLGEVYAGIYEYLRDNQKKRGAYKQDEIAIIRARENGQVKYHLKQANADRDHIKKIGSVPLTITAEHQESDVAGNATHDNTSEGHIRKEEPASLENEPEESIRERQTIDFVEFPSLTFTKDQTNNEYLEVKPLVYETIKNAMLNSNVYLLGQISITDDEYKELVNHARVRALKLQYQTITQPDIALSVALVNIAIKRYSEGNFWEYFWREIGLDYIPSSKTNLIGQVFLATLKHFHLFQIERTDTSRNAYVENIKAHAFVPAQYIQGYFDFLFAFYDKNLLRQLPENISEDFAEIADFFLSTLKDTSDSFVLRNLDNKPAKSYKLLKATRTLFAQGDPAFLSQEIYSHLKIIDDYYYDGKLNTDNDRFVTGFAQWIQSTTEQIEDGKKESRKHRGVFYRKPFLNLDRRYGVSYLTIPAQKIRSEDYNGFAHVEIRSGQFYRKEALNLYRAFGVLVSEPIKIQIINPFEEYQIIISSKNTKTFTIPKEDYRLFDEEFYQIPKLRSGQNYLLTKKSIEVRGEQPVYIDDSHLEWNEYSFSDIVDSSVIYIDKIPLTITGGFAEGANFAFESSEYRLYDSDRKMQTAYKHPVISFKSYKETLDGCFLLIRNKHIPVKSNAASIVDLPGEKDKCGVTIILEDLITDTDGLYCVYLDEPKRSPRLLCKYVLLRTLRCHTEKSRYVFADEAMITVSGDYDIKPINCESVDDGCNYILHLNNEVDAAEFSLRVYEHDYIVKVPVIVFKHGFEGKLSSSKPDYLWHTELKNDLYISMPGATEAIVYFESKGEETIVAAGNHLGKGVFRFDISAITQAIHTSKHPFNYINIFYTDNKRHTLPLYKVLNRVYVYKADVFVDDNNQVAVNVAFEGKNDLVLRFSADNTENEIVKRSVKNGINSFPELSADEIYTMQMLEVDTDDFGFISVKKKLGKPQNGVRAVNYKDISNCTIRLLGAYWSGVMLKFDYDYGLYNLKRIDENIYRGTLLEKRKPFPGSDQRIKSLATNIRIECLPDKGSLVVLSLQTEYEEGIFDPIYYDNEKKKFLRSDDLIGKKYSRYIAMYDDEAVFEAEIRRIK